MLLHNHPLFRIYFGNVKDHLVVEEYQNLPTDTPILENEKFKHLEKLMHINNLVFLKQIHSAHGINITSPEIASQIHTFTIEGDFITTNLPHLGIGIITADCLPIILYDGVHHAIAIIHAGWRGAVANIAVNTLNAMKEAYNTNPNSVQVFFGPSAKVCCYAVDEEWLNNLQTHHHAEHLAQRRETDIFFDLPQFNRLLLEDAGVPHQNFHVQYNICTICDHSFCSYRREGTDAGRQMTVVSLK